MDMALHSNTMVEINGKDFSLPKIKHSVFHNNNDVLVSSQIGRDLFTFKTDALYWNTNLIGTKNMLGYKCNKASVLFNGRAYIAWYTKEIPISEGSL
ncbi:MAG: GLPGLI family protein [Chryseobacterium sp.]|uniref:GLPGLI family protein n=1 Tax=Chryseobacterium sp. TaxID=1871047 RepID=UPI0025BBF701|nr:GLPGLI family protein [Chryseobacterium sp.]MCJ7934624.1 GLPGLI family protein [Chryseobacterium sp.]